MIKRNLFLSLGFLLLVPFLTSATGEKETVIEVTIIENDFIQKPYDLIYEHQPEEIQEKLIKRTTLTMDGKYKSYLSEESEPDLCNKIITLSIQD